MNVPIADPYRTSAEMPYRVKWEYLIQAPSRLPEGVTPDAWLNKVGLEGWEMFAARDCEGQAVYYLKRML